jgi:hypothetical protein
MWSGLRVRMKTSGSGLTDHAQVCYGGSAGTSMKGTEIEAFRQACWRNIAIALMH